MINPAVAGLQGVTDFRLGYRSQWSGLEGAPSTINFSAHTPLGRNFRNRRRNYRNEAILTKYDPYNSSSGELVSHHGLGGSVFADRAGAFSLTQINLTYAYHLPLSRKLAVSAGALIGYSQTDVDFNQIEFEVIDPLMSSVSQRFGSMDLGFGLWLYGDRFYAGLSGYKLFGNNQGVPLNNYGELLIMLTAGYDFSFSDNFSLVPSILIRRAERAPISFDGTLFAEYRDRFGIGASYRRDEALVGFLRVAIAPFMRVGYGYEFALSDINNANNGSHEISLGFVF